MSFFIHTGRALWLYRLWLYRLWLYRLWLSRLWLYRLWLYRLWLYRLWLYRLWETNTTPSSHGSGQNLQLVVLLGALAQVAEEADRLHEPVLLADDLGRERLRRGADVCLAPATAHDRRLLHHLLHHLLWRRLLHHLLHHLLRRRLLHHLLDRLLDHLLGRRLATTAKHHRRRNLRGAHGNGADIRREHEALPM